MGGWHDVTLLEVLVVFWQLPAKASGEQAGWAGFASGLRLHSLAGVTAGLWQG